MVEDYKIFEMVQSFEMVPKFGLDAFALLNRLD